MLTSVHISLSLAANWLLLADGDSSLFSFFGRWFPWQPFSLEFVQYTIDERLEATLVDGLPYK